MAAPDLKKIVTAAEWYGLCDACDGDSLQWQAYVDPDSVFSLNAPFQRTAKAPSHWFATFASTTAGEEFHSRGLEAPGGERPGPR